MTTSANVAAGGERSHAPAVWAFEVDQCVTHAQDHPYPMLIIERHLTGKGRPIYKAASLKADNVGFEMMIFEEVLREPRTNQRDCSACVFNGTRACRAAD